MKKKTLFTALTIFILAISANAQQTSLNENFNTSCPAGAHSPGSWIFYNPIASTIYSGVWTCDPTYGRSGTPGIKCTGFYGIPASLHLDTSILISPPLDISSYTGNIYLNFDSKSTNALYGTTVEMDVANNDTFYNLGTDSAINVSTEMFPIFGVNDSAHWVTHQVNLTPFKHMHPLYIGFRYTCSTTSPIPSIWYLDNIMTTTTVLTEVDNITAETSSIKIIGNATADLLTLSYDVESAGLYTMELYDMMGRTIRNERIPAHSGSNTYSVKNAQLTPGMYVIKIYGESFYGITKVIVQ